MPITICWLVALQVWGTGGLMGAPGGLKGLGLSSGAKKLEKGLFQEINQQRRDNKLAPLRRDMRLTAFAKQHAVALVDGSATNANIHDRIKSESIAPHGYWLQYGHGRSLEAIRRLLSKDRSWSKALAEDYQRIGIGVFQIPSNPPTFQAVFFLARDLKLEIAKPGLSTTQTDTVMRRVLPKLQGCYQRALEKDPNVQGQVIFQIIIGGEGEVAGANVIKGMRSEDFDVCALLVLQQLSFPRPKGGRKVTLNHPVIFRPEHGSRRLGKLSPSQIRSAFHRASGGFRRCYDRRAKVRPKLAGTLNLALTVLPDGSTKDARIAEDGIGDGPLAKCVRDRLREMHFVAPKYGGEVDVTYPLVFKPAP